MKARKVKGLDPEGPLADNLERIVRTRLKELYGFMPRATTDEAALHDMRIAAKRLRYVLEATGFCFGAPADRARRAARDLQDVLGELHDCDVMLPRVLAELEELRHSDAASVRQSAGEAEDLDPALCTSAPHRTAYRGLELLAVHVEARRALLFDRFADLWAKQERKGVWAALEGAAADPPRASGRPDAPDPSGSGAGARVR